MTSNQLTYWRTQEEKRANTIKEKDVEEKVRHNLAEEDLERINQQLTQKGLDIKDKTLLYELASWFSDKGESAMTALPSDMRKKLEEEFGVPFTSNVSDKYDNQGWHVATGIWEEIKRVFKGGGKEIIKALF